MNSLALYIPMKHDRIQPIRLQETNGPFSYWMRHGGYKELYCSETVCPRSIVHFYTPSWTYSIRWRDNFWVYWTIGLIDISTHQETNMADLRSVFLW